MSFSVCYFDCVNAPILCSKTVTVCGSGLIQQTLVFNFVPTIQHPLDLKLCFLQQVTAKNLIQILGPV